ncbi:hypothetical protein DFH09DRAFT_653677 [Mycena vulgaris]|nr:hypothetical protein DFH09DRAFT_653677 [Mycena vulgaris]
MMWREKSPFLEALSSPGDNKKLETLASAAVAEIAVPATMSCHPTSPSVASRLQQFPPEILAEIFTFCLPSKNDSFDLKACEAPWLLGKICARWRAVVISTPRLWRTISVDLCRGSSYWPQPSPHTLAHLVKIFLERSRIFPFTVRIRADQTFTSSPVLDMLMTESHRWGEVDIHIPISMLFELAKIKGRFPSLHTLTICPALSNCDPAEPPVFDAFNDAPSLRKLTVYQPRALSVGVPGAQLTSFTGSPHHLSSEMHNLVFCHINYEEGGGPDIPLAPIHLPHLRHLSITHDGVTPNPYLAELIPRLTLPQLEHLEIECWRFRVFSYLTDLVFRSQCPLRTFALLPEMSPDDDIALFLTHIPTLTELTLGSMTSAAAEALTLTHSAADPPLLPVLCALKMGAGLPGIAFSRMVASRLDARFESEDVRLRLLEVTARALDPMLAGQLRSMQVFGLRLTLMEGEGKCLSVEDTFAQWSRST